MLELFNYDDLFITVRDTTLRAYNRATFIDANLRDKPKLRRVYFDYLRSIDSDALRHMNSVRGAIRKHGRTTIQNILKYRTNPYDEGTS